RVVLEQRVEAVPGPRRDRTRGRSRPIHPQPDDLAGRDRARAVGWRHLRLIDEDASAAEGVGGAAARAGTIGGGEELVEPLAGVGRVDGPGTAAHALVAR